jgi:hypothetical protein
MKRLVFLGLAVAVFVASATILPVAANTIVPAGTKVALTGADDTGATIAYYAQQYGLPLLSLGLGAGGGAQLGTRPAVGGGLIVGAIFTLLWPGAVKSAGTALAATGPLATTVSIALPAYLEQVAWLVTSASTAAGLYVRQRRKEGDA